MTRETVPVHILTGFLGSGKTTVLNRALVSEFGPETAVIVNEFGQVALDQHFIATRSEETLVLKSGCVCCTVRADLVTTLMELAARSDGAQQQLSRVIIETSGVSDPVPILQTLRSDFNLRARFHIGTVICTADATMPAADRTRSEALMQIGAADRCVITKHDLAGVSGAGDAETWVQSVNPIAVISNAADTDISRLFSEQHVPVLELDARLSHLQSSIVKEPGHEIRSGVLRISDSHSWSAFAVWLSALIHWHGDHLLRMKGMLWDDERATWIAVHSVRRFIHPPEHLANVSETSPAGACLVFIGENLDIALIERSYRRWVLLQGGGHIGATPKGCITSQISRQTYKQSGVSL